MSDVCLFLEGTYPYVAGGVSTWVYELVKRLEDVTFSIVYLGPHRASSRKMMYEIPPNVVDFREIYLFDYQVWRENLGRPKKKGFEAVETFFKEMRREKTGIFEPLFEAIGDRNTRSLDLYDIVHSEEGWKILERVYDGEEKEPSFIDYFWTWRFLYLPLFSLLRVPLPEARVYHCASTGYAGVLGAIAKLKFNRPYLLTEHGIYTRERRIEISRADWIYSETSKEEKVLQGKEFFKDWWNSLFSFCSRLSYDKADEILTLYEGNRRIQVDEGAPREKTRIIPNGVDLGDYEMTPSRAAPEVFRIGFVGRVVPIKDVKTFLKACQIVRSEIRRVEVFIIGPVDEDKDYYEECHLLVRSENMADWVRFTGKSRVQDYYPMLDVLVLTSISEAQPIVILEAGACGIPVVASDVGACSEMLLGGDANDRLLGPSGIVTPISEPQATANAILRLLTNRPLARRMGENGRRRVEAFYQLDDVVARYRELYARYGEDMRWRA